MQGSTVEDRSPALLQHFWALVEAQGPVFSQRRVYHRAVSLLLGEVFAFGRHTVTQALLALGLTDADWSAWYRLFSHGRFREAQAAEGLLVASLQQVAATQPYVVGIDAVGVPRSSRTMPGTAWLPATCTAQWQRGLQRRQRFLHGAWLVPIERGFSRAIPLRWLPAFPRKAVATGGGLSSEAQAGSTFVQWVRQVLDQQGRANQLLLVLADGVYDCLDLWRQLPHDTLGAIRTARNRKLFALPDPATGRGRPRLYGPRARAPKDWLRERSGWHQAQLDVRGRTVKLTYRVEGPYLRQRLSERPLYLLVVRGQTWFQRGHERRREPAFYLVSARGTETGWRLGLAIQTLLGWLWQRWEMEVTHREMKSGFGVGQKQCWGPQSSIASVQWTVWVYGLLAMAGYQTWGLLTGPRAPARWWPGAQRWSWNTLWRAYRAAFWGTGEFRAVWSPLPGNWPKKEDQIIAMSNAVAAAARL